MVIKLSVVQFWSEIIRVISNQTGAARSFDFEITRMISDQICTPLSSITIIYYSGRYTCGVVCLMPVCLGSSGFASQ